ncbi:MAG: hypothetical protein J7K31_01200 [Candidatus Aenigmarchaeota archaeon]|nr:hypothetical protein [Candidatus Aenigmarchaeota archaeon]
MKRAFIFIAMLLGFVSLAPIVYAAAEFTVSGTTEYTVAWGESKSVFVNVKCLNSFQDCQCYDRVDTGSWSAKYSINPGQTEPRNFNLPPVPSSGKGQVSYVIEVKCNEFWDSTFVYKSLTINLNYPTDAQWQEYQQQQTAKAQAKAEIITAQNLISDAQSAINSAQSKITEATVVGADITQANSYLSSANTALSNAQTYLSTAQTSYNAGNYESAKTSAQQAQTSANDAKSYANQAKSSAELAMQQITKEKTEASNKISSASSAIDNAKKAIKEAEGLINNATIIGMDTTQAEGDVATARSKLQSAEDYYSEATTAFDAENYDLAKQKATSSESYAKDAESLASSAYNSLWVVYSKKRVAAEAITSADSEVSQMNEINTKLAYILRNMKTYGVDITETKTVVDETKLNTDAAEDLLSQAKNRMSAGYTDEAASLAVQARDKAAASHNRLDTIVLNLKFGIQDALEAGYKEKQLNLEQAKVAVQSASETYGADNELVIKAQEDVTNAESSLKDAKSKIDSVEASESLTELLTNAKLAFEGLEVTQQHIDKAHENANAAKMKLYQTIAAGAAGVSATGGGFLYWRRKKNRKSNNIKQKRKRRNKR